MFSSLHVVVCSDTNFGLAKLRPFFWSLRQAHSGVDLRLHYLLVNGSQAYTQEVGAYCAALGLPVSFHEIGAQVEAAFAGGVEENTKWTLAIYGRLFMAEVLPPEVERAVYMDFDTICVGDLRELLAQTAGCQTVAAAVNLPDFYSAGKEDGLNAGVLVVPVDAWRRDGIAAQLVAVFMDYKRIGAPVPFYDQGLLNAVFAGRWMKIPLAWNAQAFVDGACGIVPLAIWKSAELAKTQLFHYAGTTKPWSSPNAWMAFPKPAALAYARAMVGVEKAGRYGFLILFYRLLAIGCLELPQGSLRLRFLHRLSEVVFGRESPLVVFRWLGGAFSRRIR